MNWQALITAVVGFLITTGITVTGYFVSQLNKRLDKHDEKDDDRFDRLTIKIEAIKGNELLYEKLDAMKSDATDKRHALRAEMREASVAAYDRTEKLGEQLRAEIARLEGRLPKG